LGDGLYDLHVVATDGAGNTRISAPVTGVRVDNTVPSVTMTSPGTNVRGTVALGSVAGDPGSGISSVTYEVSPAGLAQWTATSQSWNTVQLADGLYDLRAKATDNAGNTATSAAATAVRIDNTAPATLDNAPAGAQSADVTVTLTGTVVFSGAAPTE